MHPSYAGLGSSWRFDLVVLVLLGAAITAVFANGTLDIAAAKYFFRAEPPHHWPLGAQMPWSLLYAMAPWITASLVLAGFAALGVGFARKRADWRRQATFVLLTVVLGPGVLINFVFKDHWERPRPRDIVEFGGERPYAPAPLRGEGGKSFPCGHCSVGFLYGIGWWIWRRQRPSWAAASLAAGLVAGTALGAGRLAAGGHFVSDTVWSAFLAFAVAHVLYHYVLRVPEQKTGARTRWTQHGIALLAALAGLGVLLALFVTPHGKQFGGDIALAALPRPPQVFELSARTANVEIIVVDAPAAVVSVHGELHGFGLPTSRLETRTQFEARPQPTLRYLIEQHGWFTDLDASVSVHLPLGELERIVVRVQRGNVKLADATRARVLKSGRPLLDLKTGQGKVRLPD